MKRNHFIKSCGAICLGGFALSSMMQACASVKILDVDIVGDNLIVPLQDFVMIKNEEKQYRDYIIVQNRRLKYPICIFRECETEFTELWMRCTHQGTELQVLGDKLQCPAHGSEFSKDGSFTNGPADKSLRIFPIMVEPEQLKISLKSV